MIFVGDVAIPESAQMHLGGISFNNEDDIICNLEGCITIDESNLTGVYNSNNAITILKQLGINIAGLSNNHIQDRSESAKNTIDVLSKNNFQYFGASLYGEEPSLYKKIHLKDEDCYMLSAGSYITGVKSQKNRRDKYVFVNELIYDDVFEAVKKIRSSEPDAPIICYFHWGCELELYPFPADREFAYELIDSGVSAVIGCHSHCIQGIELYKGRPIVYGLGNFLFYQGFYWNKKLVFPDISEHELAFEIKGNDFLCHWFKYDRINNSIIFIKTTGLNDELVHQFTPFKGMSHKNYKKWFKDNRRKKKLLPIWYYEDSKLNIYIKNKVLDLRARAINTMKKLGIKGKPH